MPTEPGPPQRGGLVVVDKPQGLTSHDVVARMRRIAGTRRVGHAGTLDPMATGVLLIGIGWTTRLLGQLSLHDKDYLGTVRLGRTTSTYDAEGETVATVSTAGLAGPHIDKAAREFVGEIDQRPPAVSAIKVDGKRAYARVRAGEDVVLASRRVTVNRFDLGAIRPFVATDGAELLDVDVTVTCTSGTYIRALARDLGAVLGVGGHLAALRRTRVGAYAESSARTLDQLEADLGLVPLDDVAATCFPRRDLTAGDAERVAHGARLTASGLGTGPVAAFGPAGEFLALLQDHDGQAKALAVFAA
jgi:tRNA pseudouridine55 synthase